MRRGVESWRGLVSLGAEIWVEMGSVIQSAEIPCLGVDECLHDVIPWNSVLELSVFVVKRASEAVLLCQVVEGHKELSH